MSSLEMELIFILGVWIFFLHRSIDRLEKRIKKLEDKNILPKADNSYTEKERVEKPIILEEDKVLSQKSKELSTPIDKTINTQSKRQAKKPTSTIFDTVKQYLFGGNILVRLGGVVLFFGVAFLAKYMATHSHLSLQIKIGAILSIGMILIAIGWRLRQRAGAYGQILQGVGVATLYLTIFASTKFYHLITPSSAFGVMFLIVALASFLALAQESLPMMLFASSGGFLVPILTSEGSSSHILLFGYYAVLDIGIFIIAWQKSWRALNLVGFLFTFVIAVAWGVLNYHHTLFWSTEPFWILYFAIYLTISILYTLKRRFEPKNLIDSTLVFGLPLIAFPLQISLVRGFTNGEAISSIVLGTLYLILSFYLRNNKQADILVASFKAISLIFYTISIGYIFDRDVKVALWAMEAAAIFWSAIKQHKRFSRYFAQILLIFSLATLNHTQYWESLIAVISTLFIIYWMDYSKKIVSPIERLLAHLLTFWVLLIWFDTTPSKLIDLGFHIDFATLFALMILSVSFYIVDKIFKWKRIERVLELYWIFGIIFYLYPLLQYPISQINPFTAQGLIGWLGLNILGYFLLNRYDKVWQFSAIWHILALWFNTTILMIEAHYLALYHWHLIKLANTLGGVPLIIVSLTLLLLKRYPKCLIEYKKLYHFVGVGGLSIVTIFYAIYLFSLAPNPQSYLPVFNIIDIMQILSTYTLYLWISINTDRFTKLNTIFIYAPYFLFALVSLSIIYARAVHIYGKIPYTFDNIWHSLYFQTGLSILWSIAGIILMLLSKYFVRRSWWVGGFGILVLVVLKLFFVELSGSETIERIVSFIVVGVLLLLIGYFVPIPPTQDRK